MNGLFREEDYPSAEKLRAKFGVKLEVLPIPSGDDFRVTLSEEEQARVARDIDESVRQSMNRGTKDLWVRLTDVVTHMVDKLNDPDSRFHASLVTNILDLVDLLLECPARFVPVEMRQTGTRGAGDGTRKEA